MDESSPLGGEKGWLVGNSIFFRVGIMNLDSAMNHPIHNPTLLNIERKVERL